MTGQEAGAAGTAAVLDGHQRRCGLGTSPRIRRKTTARCRGMALSRSLTCNDVARASELLRVFAVPPGQAMPTSFVAHPRRTRTTHAGSDVCVEPVSSQSQRCPLGGHHRAYGSRSLTEGWPCDYRQSEEPATPSFETRTVRSLRASSRATTSSRCAPKTVLASQSAQCSRTCQPIAAWPVGVTVNACRDGCGARVLQ